MKAAIAIVLVVLVAVPVLAQPPVNGTYKSTDLGGTMLEGRYSELWFGAKLSVNNTINEQSWDGVTLGTQWHWYCPWIVAPPVLILDTVDGNGNGQKIWLANYIGGFCWLNGTGPWGGGDASYLANINNWTTTVTETYQNFVEVGTVRSINATGNFIGYNEECMTLSLTNAEKLGDTNGGPLATDYPNFWDWFTCTDVGTAGPGEWGDISAITFTVTDCQTVSVKDRVWGAVKDLYRE